MSTLIKSSAKKIVLSFGRYKHPPDLSPDFSGKPILETFGRYNE